MRRVLGTRRAVPRATGEFALVEAKQSLGERLDVARELLDVIVTGAVDRQQLDR